MTEEVAQPEVERHLGFAMEIIRNSTFIRAYGEGTLWIQTGEGLGPPAFSGSVRSERFTCWIIFLYSTKYQVLVDTSFARKVARFVEGSQEGNLPIELNDQINSEILNNPIVEAIMSWLDNARSFPFRSRFEPWFKSVKDCASLRFPKASNVFSRKLKPLIPALENLGIQIQLGRDSRGSHVTISMTQSDYSFPMSSCEFNSQNSEEKKTNQDDDAITVIKKLQLQQSDFNQS